MNPSSGRMNAHLRNFTKQAAPYAAATKRGCTSIVHQKPFHLPLVSPWYTNHLITCQTHVREALQKSAADFPKSRAQVLRRLTNRFGAPKTVSFPKTWARL